MSDRSHLYGPRPDLGELKTGQPVMVYRASSEMRREYHAPRERAIPAVIVKVARVWVTVEFQGSFGRVEVRLRKDTQSEASGYSQGDRYFYTLAQHEWNQARDEASRFLTEQGINVRPGSTWKDRLTQLADILRAGIEPGQ